MKTLWFTLMLLVFAILYAGEKNSNLDIAKYYSNLSKDYEKNLSIGNYQKAYTIAIEQLNLDPSDTVAYIRMAIATQHINVDRQKILKEYSSKISERDSFHVQIKSIANALLNTPKASD